MDFLAIVWIIHVPCIHVHNSIRKEIILMEKAGEIFSFGKVSLTDSMIIFGV